MPASRKKMFAKLEDKTLPPLVPPGPNVFTSGDYATETGIAPSSARARVSALIRSGEVRRVRTKRPTGIKIAYEYVGEGV